MLSSSRTAGLTSRMHGQQPTSIIQGPHLQHAQERQLRRALAQTLVSCSDLRGSEAQQVVLKLYEACGSGPCRASRTGSGGVSSSVPDMVMERLDTNIPLLRDVCGPSASQAIAQSPELLAADLATWLDFLDGLGVPSHMVAKVCSESPGVLVQGSVYTAGLSVLFFKSMGFGNDDIVKRIVHLYPFLLSKDLDRDINPVVEYLAEAGCQGDNLRRLVWEFPRIFSKDYRRQVRKFQYLSVYGLSPTTRLSDNERLMMRVM